MEIWKPLRNFPSYDGSTEGRIRNIRTQRIMKPNVNENGYEQICLRRNNRQYNVKVHRVIAETFLGEQSNMDVRHRDGDLLNNRVDNLYWSTRRETVQDAFKRGTRIPRSQIQIRVIETGETFPSIRACARAMDISQSEICQQLKGTRSNVKGYHFEQV